MIRRSLGALRAQLRPASAGDLPAGPVPRSTAAEDCPAAARLPVQRDEQLTPRASQSLNSRLSGLDVQLYAARLDAGDRSARSNRPLAQALADAARQQARTAGSPAARGPGRLELLWQLQRAIEDMFQRHGRLALMFIDLQGFELPEARDGARGAGTNLLTIVATRAEHGGDDEGGSTQDGAASLAGITEAIRGHIEGPYCIDGRAIEIGASVGIALAPVGDQRRQALLRCAGTR